MNLDNQSTYWNSVAHSKTFTHPLNENLLLQFVSKDSLIIDYGCGYGRIIKQLNDSGFNNVKGFDTSIELINRGRKNRVSTIFHFESLNELPIENNSVDCILLFAVLTCIPENIEQQNLISVLKSKLKPNGILYISDYYLQTHSTEMERYEYLNDDKENYGVFHLPEDAVFRHHTKEWMHFLLKDFQIISETMIEVKTMNGNNAEAFQMIVQFR